MHECHLSEGRERHHGSMVAFVDRRGVAQNVQEAFASVGHCSSQQCVNVRPRRVELILFNNTASEACAIVHPFGFKVAVISLVTLPISISTLCRSTHAEAVKEPVECNTLCCHYVDSVAFCVNGQLHRGQAPTLTSPKAFSAANAGPCACSTAAFQLHDSAQLLLVSQLCLYFRYTMVRTRKI